MKDATFPFLSFLMHMQIIYGRLFALVPGFSFFLELALWCVCVCVCVYGWVGDIVSPHVPATKRRGLVAFLAGLEKLTLTQRFGRLKRDDVEFCFDFGEGTNCWNNSNY